MASIVMYTAASTCQPFSQPRDQPASTFQVEPRRCFHALLFPSAAMISFSMVAS